ncbi:hypothetical protein OM076_28400 [Solirubrobacter ginsenosidimutans]|uniref:Uncharacterized protein n=1 Tax=Solirubrobacter ginsenosidimutans TaxID=490573 RepID=A0A9X3MZN1_9ACTN|nr:hypothetical protein [Solirubrobacter ginsenosidimutans]MDA0164225.1 hypothetical protein [Solirubrobacter ginsenosidimutans]
MPRRSPLFLAVVLTLACAAPPARAQVAGAQHAASSAGHLAFVTQGNGSRSTLRVVSPEGVVGAAEDIGETFDTPVVAVGAAGDAVVAWIDRRELWARYRPAGGTLGPAELVTRSASTYIESLPLAVDAAGAVTTAWAPESGRGGLHVRTRDPVSGWGPVQTLGGIDVYRPKLALTGNGNAVIAWAQHQRKDRNPSQIAVASRLAGQPFGAPKVVVGVQHDPDYGRIAANDRGDVAIVWIVSKTRRRPGDVEFSIHGVFSSGGGPFGRPVTLSRVKEATSPNVAVQASGRMILAWRDNSTHRVEARVREPSGVLGRPRILTHDLDVNTGPAALTAGRGVVAWSDYDRAARRRVIRFAQATDDGHFGPAAVIARVRDTFYDPAFAVSAPGFSVVAVPPFAPSDPVEWQRVAVAAS